MTRCRSLTSLRTKGRENCFFLMNLAFRNGCIHFSGVFLSFLPVLSRKQSFLTAGYMRQ